MMRFVPLFLVASVLVAVSRADEDLARTLLRPSQGKLDAFAALPLAEQEQMLQDGKFRQWMLGRSEQASAQATVTTQGFAVPRLSLTPSDSSDSSNGPARIHGDVHSQSTSTVTTVTVVTKADDDDDHRPYEKPETWHSRHRARHCPTCPAYTVSRQLYVSEFGSLNSTDCAPDNQCALVSQAQAIVNKIRKAGGNTVYEYVIGLSDTDGGVVEPSGFIDLYPDDYMTGAGAASRPAQVVNTTYRLSKEFCLAVNAFAGLEGHFSNVSNIFTQPSVNFTCAKMIASNYVFMAQFIAGGNIVVDVPSTALQVQARAITVHGNYTTKGATTQINGDTLFFANVTVDGQGPSTAFNLVSGQFQPPKSGPVVPIGLTLNGNGKPLKVFTGNVVYNGGFLHGFGSTVTLEHIGLPLKQNTILQDVVVVYARDASSFGYLAGAPTTAMGVTIQSKLDVIRGNNSYIPQVTVTGVTPLFTTSPGSVVIWTVSPSNYTQLDNSVTLNGLMQLSSPADSIVLSGKFSALVSVPSLGRIAYPAANAQISGSSATIFNANALSPMLYNSAVFVGSGGLSFVLQFVVSTDQILLSGTSISWSCTVTI